MQCDTVEMRFCIFDSSARCWMGKQDPNTGSTSQKVLDAPCSELYQASLKCELS